MFVKSGLFRLFSVIDNIYPDLFILKAENDSFSENFHVFSDFIIEKQIFENELRVYFCKKTDSVFFELIGMPYPSDTSLGPTGWEKDEGFLILSGGKGLTKTEFSSIIKTL